MVDVSDNKSCSLLLQHWNAYCQTQPILQDALENVFSQTDKSALKPSAYQFLIAIRAVTISQGMLKKVVGSSYDFEEETHRDINFLDIICEDVNGNQEEK